MKYPALDVSDADGDRLLAVVDDFSPSAIEFQGVTTTIFFSSAKDRDLAGEAITRALPEARTQSRDVDDEDWARRSQENLTPITVGRITVTPPWFSAHRDPSDQPLAPSPTPPRPLTSHLRPLSIVISPSMGFGTGHHATTRLCLAALQTLELAGTFALDVGTGSGVLAIAARLLGAREAVGIDNDADAIQSATENLAMNPDVDQVRFQVTDLRSAPLPLADVVTANLTGALLIRSAALLVGALTPGGTLIVSGLQVHERDEVVAAFAAFSPCPIAWEAHEETWTGLAFNPGARIRV